MRHLLGCEARVSAVASTLVKCSQIMGKETLLCFCKRVLKKYFQMLLGQMMVDAPWFFHSFSEVRFFGGPDSIYRCVHLVKSDSTTIIMMWFLSFPDTRIRWGRKMVIPCYLWLLGRSSHFNLPLSFIYLWHVYLFSHPQLLWNTKKRIWIMWDVMHVTWIRHDYNPFGVSRLLGM